MRRSNIQCATRGGTSAICCRCSSNIDIPVYLGCDWQNVPLHLPSTFTAWQHLTNSPCVRIGMLDEFGLTWPWESLHVEALAWFDHWLKGHDTGILDGPPVRYALPGDGQWHQAETWPPQSDIHRTGAARRRCARRRRRRTGWPPVHGAGGRFRPGQAEPDRSAVAADLDQRCPARGARRRRRHRAAVGRHHDGHRHRLDRHAVRRAPDGTSTPVTAGWLRACLREVDETASRTGAPVLPCRRAAAVPVGETVQYRIPLVPNARRFGAGHRIALTHHQ